MAGTTIPEEEQVPEGWTTDPKLLEQNLEGEEGLWVNRCGLENPVTLLHSTPESGNVEALITAGGRYYFMEYLGYSIFEILRPKSLHGILRTMRDGRERFMSLRKVEEVEPVETEEELRENQERCKESLAEEERLVARLKAGFWDWEPHEPD
ncbi:uncharacterized protein LDX57_012644 [Aspergillus melleus]|uniref:uncharacterized protein n=1 Tax=Aspergillus melleus TaxID=138277 RepID=UPI001E8EBA37|nr:uncharacterized protein LDX57_012644 [Aspergillus melleus]KAH8435015.1 hypothetical protein LDX57_012644 [Aspergillus melleus]